MNKVKLKSLLIPKDITIKQAMHKLNETGEKILFIVRDKRILGTATDGDIRRGLIKGYKFSDKVEKVMFKRFVALYKGEPKLKEKAQKMMIAKEIEQIPVLTKDGEIIDVILWMDIFGRSKPTKQKPLFSTPVVIMAGGKGTRLDPFTKILPKPLIPIGEKPIVEMIMDEFYGFGFWNFFLTLNYKKEYVKMYFKENSFPYSINSFEESDYMGTAGSLSLLKDKIKDTFFVTNCDIIVKTNFQDVLRWHKAYNNLITLIGCHREVKIPYGILEMNNGVLNEFIEKPRYDVLINTGVYVLEPEVISLIPKNKQMDMNVLIDIASKKGKVSVYPIHEGWFDIGQWDEYRKSIKELGAY